MYHTSPTFSWKNNNKTILYLIGPLNFTYFFPTLNFLIFFFNWKTPNCSRFFFLNPDVAGAISFIFIAKFQLHILWTWLIHRWRPLKFECLSKYKAGQSLKLVAEANNLNLFKKKIRTHSLRFKNLWSLRKLLFYVEKENINPMLTRQWKEAKSQLQTWLLHIFSWHNPSRNATQNPLLSRGDNSIWPSGSAEVKMTGLARFMRRMKCFHSLWGSMTMSKMFPITYMTNI